MIPLALDSRPSSDVPIVPLALTTNDRVSTARVSGAIERPKSTRRFELFVHVPVTGFPSSRRSDSETSSPKARGITARLIDEMLTPDQFRIVIFSSVEMGPVP